MIAYTWEILEAYTQAAIENAQELLEEARLLLEREKYARTYFLSVASIEETGKANIASDSKNRNLASAVVQAKVTKNLADHSMKISSAFAGWLEFSTPKQVAVEKAVQFITDLQQGRERSMYVDILESNRILAPKTLIRKVVAEGSVAIADRCLHFMKKSLEKRTVRQTTIFEDKFYALKIPTLTSLLNTADFWWYYMGESEESNASFAECAIKYHDRYFIKNMKFKNA